MVRAPTTSKSKLSLPKMVLKTSLKTSNKNKKSFWKTRWKNWSYRKILPLASIPNTYPKRRPIWWRPFVYHRSWAIWVPWASSMGRPTPCVSVKLENHPVLLENMFLIPGTFFLVKVSWYRCFWYRCFHQTFLFFGYRVLFGPIGKW